MKKLKHLLKQHKQFVLFLFLMLFFRSAIADWYHVPSSSMMPTIYVGDRVYVDKLAYDAKIPFTDWNLNRHAEPNRGDVVVFDSDVADKLLIKRVIGIPGDIVELRDNHLFLNGRRLVLSPSSTRHNSELNAADHKKELVFSVFRERIPQMTATGEKGARTYDIQVFGNSMSIASRNNFGPLKVPSEYLWVMGDNRDNSADSRVIGLVPRRELVGKAEKVLISFDKDRYYLPRKERLGINL